jgi:serine/threonine protein kinase
MTAAPERKIGRFPIIKVLGRGSQGAVYLARDPDLDRLVAIKLVAEIHHGDRADAGVSPQARNLAQLRHPNIVALHEAGRMHGFTFLVFEHLEGTVLREEIDKSGALPLPRAYSTMIQIVDAMAYAHAKGILHLDLNPNNIMRDGADRPRIVDFDLSRSVDAPAAPSDVIAGTASYMAPEYFSTEPVDARADVYALGRIFHDLLTGTRPVPPTSGDAMTGQIRTSELDLEALRPVDRTGHFIEVIRRATSRNPAERFPDARRMHDALLAAWAQSEGSIDPQDAALHGTIAYVMKRIERKGDFPAVSRTLAEVNQLTSGDKQSPMSRLTDVVLRDYALTNRLLKLANSAGHSPMAGKIKTVSDAIRLLGTEQVRLTCNGLACFGHFAGRKQDRRLREESIAAFITGLIARHLAAHSKSKEVEQAFLAGMLFTLGRMLALYYFSEDHEEIEQLVAGGASEDEAARSVLGITLSDLGAAVGRVWGLPQSTLDCMAGAEAMHSQPPDPPLCAIVRLAHHLIEVDSVKQPANASLLQASARLRPHMSLELPALHALLGAGVEKFKAFAPVLEVDVAQSRCIQRIEKWICDTGESLAESGESPADAAA